MRSLGSSRKYSFESLGTGVLVILCIFSIQAVRVTGQATPIRLDQIVEVLRLKGLSVREKNEKLVSEVNSRGVAFELTSQIEESLTKYGASEALIESIRLHQPRPSPSSRPANEIPAPTPAPSPAAAAATPTPTPTRLPAPVPVRYTPAELDQMRLIPYLRNYRYGFCNEKKEIIIQPKYEEVSVFADGRARVKLGNKTGIIDKTGKEIAAIKYDAIMPFSDDLAVVMLDGKYGYINRTGVEIVSPKYNDALSFSEDRGAVRMNNNWGFVDKSGNEITALKYESVAPFSNGLAKVKLDDKFGFVDKAGKEVIPTSYDFADSFREGVAVVRVKDKWGFIGTDGNRITSFKFSAAARFSEGLAGAATGGVGWGFINTRRKEVIDAKYFDASRFSEGLSVVVIRDGTSRLNYYIIDKNGKKMSDALQYVVRFKDTQGNNEFSEFSEGLLKVSYRGKFGFVDKTGKAVIPANYDDAYPFFRWPSVDRAER
jgi:hypothetical protein